MKKAIFIRHGESIGNTRGILTGRTNSTLTERGLDEAKVVAEKLNKELHEPVDVYYSPLFRTVQTAMEICKEVNVNWSEACDLLLAVNYSPEQGKLKSEIPNLKTFIKHRNTTPEFISQIEQLRNKIKNIPRTSIFVTHAGVIRKFLQMEQNAGGEIDPDNLVKNCEPVVIEVPNA